jgi:glycine/D-amino acid oxidase-like deaminating enzyme
MPETRPSPPPGPRPPIEEACYWLASERSAAAEPLRGDRRADVAVIGGGFTGLWTALFVKEIAPETSVALLEGESVGYGGSGRNAGIVGETVDHSHELAAAHFGEDEARELARIGRENLDELERFLSERGIDAEFRRPGQLVMALTPAHVAQLETSVAFAHRLGLSDWRLLSAGEARAEVDSPRYLGAAFAPRSGTIHPVKLVLGLKAEALRRGVAVFERTPVESISAARGGVRVQTARGTVDAGKAVLATNAYSHRLRPGLLRRFLPLYDYVVVSEPLTSAERDSIGWKKGQGVIDARTFFNYYRPTSDGRILFGTSDAAYYGGNRVDASCDHSEAHYRSLVASFVLHFPNLSRLRFPYAWGGPICSTARLTPFFGTAGSGRVHYGLGYTGHGIGSTRIAGRILASLALGRRHPFLDLSMVRRKPFPFPPEPLRSAAVAAVTSRLRRVDAGEERGLLLKLLDAMGIGFSS